jgi:hypothetical protein
MGILSLVLAIAPVILQALSANKTLPSSIGNIIEIAIQSVTGFLGAYQSNPTGTPKEDIVAVLSGIAALTAVLQQQKDIPAADLLLVQALDKAALAGLAAYSAAAAGVVPGSLQPITPA